MPILWNTSKRATLETKYDGQLFIFLPNEKKKIFIPDIYNHLIYKLEEKGLVMIQDDPMPSEEHLKKMYLSGISKRKKMLKGVLVNFQTANNERKATHQGIVEPNEYEIECVKEIREIEKEVKETSAISKEDATLVKDYLKDEGIGAEEVAQTQAKIREHKDGSHELEDSSDDEAQGEAPVPRRGRPRKEHAAA